MNAEMELKDECELSFYQDLGLLDERKNARLVQDIRDRRLAVRKDLAIYHEEVFRALMERPAAHVPEILFVARDGERLVVIERYVSGVTLQDALDHGRQFTVTETREILKQLCVILRDLHGRQPAIIHRDIKPANVMLGQDGEIWLMDLNAAKHWVPEQSRDTELIGTAGYAAPEQYGFGASGTATDIYGLGTLANVLLCGHLPAEGVAEGELEALIQACCAIDPADRPKTADEVLWQLAGTMTKNGRKKRYFRHLPPGFRALDPGACILAAIAYVCIFSLCLTLEGKTRSGTASEMWAYRIASLVMLLGMVFLTGNYLDVWQKLPFTRSERLPARIFGVIFWNAVIIFVCVAGLVAADGIFKWSV